MEQPEFKTLKSYSINFGTRNFIELALKEATEGTDSNKFISISKGYTDQSGNKRYKRSLGFEVNTEVVKFLSDSLKELNSELEGSAPKKKKE